MAECKYGTRDKMKDNNLPMQNIFDIMEEFYKYMEAIGYNIVEGEDCNVLMFETMDDTMTEMEKNCAISRLVTVVEQFFRAIMNIAFAEGKLELPDNKCYNRKIVYDQHKKLLIPTLKETQNYLVSMTYTFQQLDTIKEEMEKLNTEYCDIFNKQWLGELFKLRHNIIHTVVTNAPPYEDIVKYYEMVENMFKIVLDGLNIPKWSFYNVKTQVLDRYEDYDGYIEAHKKMLEYFKTTKQTTEVCVEIAFSYLDRDDLQNAEKYTNLAYASDRNNAEVNLLKGIILDLDEDSHQAYNFYKKVTDIDVYNKDAYLYQIKYLIENSRLDECVELLLYLIEKMPSTPDFYFEYANVMEKLDKITKSEQNFNKGDELIINFVKLHNNNSNKCDPFLRILYHYQRNHAYNECMEILGQTISLY